MSFIQSQREKFDTQIEVYGKFYFKVSIIKQCFEEHLTSPDRLKSTLFHLATMFKMFILLFCLVTPLF